MSDDLRPIGELPRRAAPEATIVLRRATVVDPRSGIDGPFDVVVREGRIAELAESESFDAADTEIESVDAEGLHVFPAFFDPHVHLRTPGREDEEDVATGSRAAAAGGFCGILAMANTDPVVDSASIVEALRESAEREASVGVGFLATVTRGMRGEELTEMADLRDAGAVAFSDDGLPLRSAQVLRRAMRYQRLSGGTIALHEEDPDLSADGVMHEGAVSARVGMAGIPSVSESTMIARDAALAGYEQATIHVQHLSAAESVAAVAAAKAAGVAISCEATPHHLILTDEAVLSLDPAFKMNPPLRAEADRLALIEGLRDGTIDCIATDHAPHSSEEKEEPFELAPMGVTGLETAFAALHTDLVLPGSIELALLVEKLSAGAQLFGFAPPTVEPGAEANLVLVDLAGEWTVGEAGYESRSSNSCFAGRELTGRVLMTIAAGSVAYRQRAFAIGAAP